MVPRGCYSAQVVYVWVMRYADFPGRDHRGPFHRLAVGMDLSASGYRSPGILRRYSDLGTAPGPAG